ncbi:MAG: tagaturonate epimerase family protein [Synergistaceae bacterium]|nr:tagaturonate epimerase family protein [Synergistaceae bacterium]
MENAVKVYNGKFLPKQGLDPSAYGVYPNSIREMEGVLVYMARESERDVLIAVGKSDFEGVPDAAGTDCVRAPLTHKNADILRQMFPFCAPRRVLGEKRTIGVGDRLGIATSGHIRAFRRFDALPVFAQQSIRELNLTGRTYEDVLDAATFAVFREGFSHTHGFGADGDHLKTPEEVKYALSRGYTIITLDCGEHIRASAMTDAEVSAAYTPWVREADYLEQSVRLDNAVLAFSAEEFRRMALIYGKAIEFAESVYHSLLSDADVDFEISIDETVAPTTPAQHYFVAKEMRDRGVKFASLAPRFCGEFQKGVDYVGDVKQFQREFQVHAKIAEHFGHKISVHSGSDKFKVFPVVGEETRFHLKTAGTSWLEAMRLVAMKDAPLYREVHRFALSALEDARRRYHVSADPSNIPDVSALADGELPSLFSQSDARQVIHITYGSILSAKAHDGSFLFRDRLFCLWRENEDAYAELLNAHIGRHLELLRCKAR